MTPERDTLERIVEALFDAWGRYEAFFGEPPHGTHKQLAALVELAPALIPSKAEREFLEAAMEWGANSVKWDTASEPDDRRVLINEAQEICVRMDRAYRALLT